MTNTTHTPGPWDWQDGRLIGGLNGEGMDVSLDMDANARLIASAPDLLAALEDAVEALIEARYYPSEIKRLRAAIARAKGE